MELHKKKSSISDDPSQRDIPPSSSTDLRSAYDRHRGWSSWFERPDRGEITSHSLSERPSCLSKNMWSTVDQLATVSSLTPAWTCPKHPQRVPGNVAASPLASAGLHGQDGDQGSTSFRRKREKVKTRQSSSAASKLSHRSVSVCFCLVDVFMVSYEVLLQF